ncbi:MAG: hypothetical protein V2I46_07340 [Bacteroides sp.]|jgi:hypothetical protein|nr:hypothetical protein [Bacteroides sp.]
MKKPIFTFASALLMLFPLILSGTPPFDCQITVTGGETSICQGQPLVLIARVDKGLSETAGHQWEAEGKLLSASDKAFVKFDTSHPGIFKVKYFAMDQEGNQAQCELEINVASLPSVEIVENFGVFQRILFKKPMLSLHINSTESHTFQWFLDEDAIPGANGSEFRPKSAGKYHARVTSPQGCRTFSKEIIIE